MIFPSFSICIALFSLFLGNVLAHSKRPMSQDVLRHEHLLAKLAHDKASIEHGAAAAAHLPAIEAHYEVAKLATGTVKAEHLAACNALVVTAEQHERQERRHARLATRHDRAHQSRGGVPVIDANSRYQAEHSKELALNSQFYAKSIVKLLKNAESHDEKALWHKTHAQNDRSEALGLSSKHDIPTIKETKKKLQESRANVGISLLGLGQS